VDADESDLGIAGKQIKTHGAAPGLTTHRRARAPVGGTGPAREPSRGHWFNRRIVGLLGLPLGVARTELRATRKGSVRRLRDTSSARGGHGPRRSSFLGGDIDHPRFGRRPRTRNSRSVVAGPSSQTCERCSRNPRRRTLVDGHGRGQSCASNAFSRGPRVTTPQ
jgi:hypothetical protein